MTTLLAIDTAADICSVAIARDNSLCHRASSGARKHAADVLPMIKSLLDEFGITLNDIDAIVMVSGPGSFTGLRIGTAVAQGLSFGADIPIVRISSLAMLARAAFLASEPGKGTECVIYACLHAREDEYYFAVYLDDGQSQPKVLTADHIATAASIRAQLDLGADDSRTIICAGTGWLQAALLDSSTYEQRTDISGDAATLAELGKYAWSAGHTDAAEQALPIYLKEDMAYRKS